MVPHATATYATYTRIAPAAERCGALTRRRVARDGLQGDFHRRTRRAPPPRHRNRWAATALRGRTPGLPPRGGRARRRILVGTLARCRRRGLSGSPRPRTPLASRRRPQPATLPRPARRRTLSSPTSGSSTCSPRASRRGSSRPAGAEVVPAGTADRGEALSGVGGHGSRLRGQSVSLPPRRTVGPAQGAHLAPSQLRHEEGPGDSHVEAATLSGDPI